MIPMLKAIISHYRDDPVWADVRPPFVEMPKAEAEAAIHALAEAHGFKLEIPVAA
jgi:hypothetical protein